jgi:hypothetical protein
VSYPEVIWERVDCEQDSPRAHPVHVRRGTGGPEIVGNRFDYVAAAQGLIQGVNARFPVAFVTGEQTVASFFGGIVGPNEYTLQINTNANATTSACAGHSGCTVWQQFIYATDYLTKGRAAVFMEYWLINYGDNCPSGWRSFSPDCWLNSSFASAPDVPAADLGDVQLSNYVTPGGTDAMEFFYDSEGYRVTGNDNVLGIGSVWKQVEFNVLGDIDGSEAVFNPNTSLTVNLSIFDGSQSAPACLANSGTTGETNNLTLGPCQTGNYQGPYLEFTESNPAKITALGPRSF